VAQNQLDSTNSELEKQKILNEKLENDLLSMDNHKPNGDAPTSELGEPDILAGLDLGRKTSVSYHESEFDINFL
jgi:homeobox protein cut-like